MMRASPRSLVQRAAVRAVSRAVSRSVSRFTVRAVVRGAIAIGALSAMLVPLARPALAQDRPAGVSLTLEYEPGRKIAMMVLPVVGAGGDSVKTIIERDLDYSDRFQLVPSISSPDAGQPINYALAATAGAAGIVQGQLLPSGWLRVMLHDVAGKKVYQQNDFPLPTAVNTDNWRMGVHRISDQIEQWVTGQPGIAATRIAFTRDERVWVVDSDGANARPVTPRGLSPKWHPSGRYVVYHSFDEDRIRLYVTDVITGAQRSLTNEKGANDLTPAISPDGRSVAFSRSVEATAGQTDLFVMPFDGGRATRISVARTRSRRNSTSPAATTAWSRMRTSIIRPGTSPRPG